MVSTRQQQTDVDATPTARITRLVAASRARLELEKAQTHNVSSTSPGRASAHKRGPRAPPTSPEGKKCKLHQEPPPMHAIHTFVGDTEEIFNMGSCTPPSVPESMFPPTGTACPCSPVAENEAVSMTMDCAYDDADDVQSSRRFISGASSASTKTRTMLSSASPNVVSWYEPSPSTALADACTNSYARTLTPIPSVNRGLSCHPSESSLCSDIEQQISLPVSVVSDYVDTENDTFALCGEMYESRSDQVERALTVLHAESPHDVVQREGEVNSIAQFIKDGVFQQRGGVLYCVGDSGCGKSVCVQQALKLVCSKVCEQSYVVVQFSGYDYGVCGSLFSEIQGKVVCGDRGGDGGGAKVKRLHSQVPGQWRHDDEVDSLKALVTTRSPTRNSTSRTAGRVVDAANPAVVLILDDVDVLLSKNKETCLDLFKLSAETDSRLLTVAVSNNSHGQPPEFAQVLQFRPYTCQQVYDILQQRLSSLPFPLFTTTALQLCTQVRHGDSDIRTALAYCQASIEQLRDDVVAAKARQRVVARGSVGMNARGTKSYIVTPSVVKSALKGKGVNGATWFGSLGFEEGLVLCAAAVACAQSKAKKGGSSLVQPRACVGLQTRLRCPGPSSLKHSPKPPLHPQRKQAPFTDIQWRNTPNKTDIRSVLNVLNANVKEIGINSVTQAQVHSIVTKLASQRFVTISGGQGPLQELQMSVKLKDVAKYFKGCDKLSVLVKRMNIP